jgi:hypothetical protein
MQAVGEVLKWLGFGISGLAIVTLITSLIVQVVTFVTRRELHRTAAVTFFRGSQVVVVGFLIAGLGLALLGQIPWLLWIIGVIALGVPAFILLRARINFPEPRSN